MEKKTMERTLVEVSNVATQSSKTALEHANMNKCATLSLHTVVAEYIDSTVFKEQMGVFR